MEHNLTSPIPAMSWDHFGFYMDGAPFLPHIQEPASSLSDESNIVIVHLPASLTDDLDWKAPLLLAEKIIASGKRILWDLDLHLSTSLISRHDKLSLLAHSRAIEEFSETIYKPFFTQTFGVCLFRGSIDFKSYFLFHEWEEDYKEWWDELWETFPPWHTFKKKTIDRFSLWGQRYDSLFCAHLFSEYLHRLISFLPDTVLPIALIDASEELSFGWGAQLLSKKRFEHMAIGVKGTVVPYHLSWKQDLNAQRWVGRSATLPPLALCMPSDPFCDERVLLQLDECIKALSNRQMPYRVICEEKLTEEWEGLDQLMVISQAVSPQGKRMLQGFCAAGGEVLDLFQN